MVRLDDNLRKVKYTHSGPYPTVTLNPGIMLIPCTLETITRFDHQRGNLSRAEYLDELLDLAEGKLLY